MQIYVFKILEVDEKTQTIFYEYGRPFDINGKLTIDSPTKCMTNFNMPRGLNACVAEQVVINSIEKNHPYDMAILFQKYAISKGYYKQTDTRKLSRVWRKNFLFEKFYKSKICKWFFPKKYKQRWDHEAVRLPSTEEFLKLYVNL